MVSVPFFVLVDDSLATYSWQLAVSDENEKIFIFSKMTFPTALNFILYIFLSGSTVFINKVSS